MNRLNITWLYQDVNDLSAFLTFVAGDQFSCSEMSGFPAVPRESRDPMPCFTEILHFYRSAIYRLMDCVTV
ncbi:hypothetical protein XENTR_v10017019 [Xenopus tropicalis]|nr:hypothetical protein XENTR_v10017019 [Xenopus tropicalis]